MKRIIPIILTLAFFLSLLSSCARQKEHIITIAESHHGCSIAVEEDRFYGTDENGKLWRIYWHDTAESQKEKPTQSRSDQGRYFSIPEVIPTVGPRDTKPQRQKCASINFR